MTPPLPGRRRPWLLVPSLLVGLLPLNVALAQSGVWTNPGGGSWTNAGNWLGGAIASGAGNTADFSTLTLAADATVTLDSARSVGALTFEDHNSAQHNWLLTTGTGGPLTLAGTAPTITVNSATSTISAALVGTVGLTKAGAGRLALTGANTYSGVTTVSMGTLALGTTTLSGASPLSIASGAVAESDGTLSLNVGSSDPSIDITGAGTLRLTSRTNGALYADLYFGPNHSGNTYYGARLATVLDLGSAQRYIFGKSGHNGVGQYGLTHADCQFAGSISGSGGLTFIAQMTYTGSPAMEVPFCLNAANTFTGPVEIRRGSIYLGNAGAFTNANVLTFNPALGNNARFFLYGNNASVSDLSSPGLGTAVIANGNLKTGAKLTLGAVTLTINQNHDATFSGTIRDVFSEYDGSGNGTTGPLNLLKKGPAVLTLGGVHTYTGTTTISAGTLRVDGSLAGASMAVQNGGVLAGAGTLTAPVTIQSGGLLAPGDGGIGALTVNNSLTLAGSTVMELSKSGTTLSSDQVGGLSTVNYGGTLTVTNISDSRALALAAGDTFTLFAAANYTGAFNSLTLPALPGGLVWDTSNLMVNGSITVIVSGAPPLLTTQPQSLSVNAGTAASFSAIAAGPRPLGYQWQKNGTNLAGATSMLYSILSASSNDVGGYCVVVTNLYGSITSSLASLSLVAPPPLTSVTNGLVVYLNLDNNLNAQLGTSVNGALYTGGATNGPRYKPGVIGSAATFANAGTSSQPNDWVLSLGNLESVYSNSFSVSFWERTPSSDNWALMGNKNWNSGANPGWVISALQGQNVNWNTVGGSRQDLNLNPPFSDGTWHLATVTFDRSTGTVTSYLDALAAATGKLNPSNLASLNAGYNTLVGGTGNGAWAGTGDVDDLGVWNRVLAPQEVAAIFGAGLIGKPLNYAVPGQTPVITNQPVSLRVVDGGTAVFSVAATAPDASDVLLAYQWRFNGANIAGATNAILVLSSVDASNQGVYTVLVSSAAGGAISSGAVLTIYSRAVTGQWDFRQGDLRATVGTDLVFVGDTAQLTSFPVTSIHGAPAPVMAFGGNSPSQGFQMWHGAKPNGGGQFVNQYTLVLDVMYPASSSGQLRALVQTDPFNHPGDDAEFYISGSSSAPDGNGLGAEGRFDGSLTPEVWHRIALAVDLRAPAGQQLSKYIDGALVGSQSLPGGVDGRYALGPAAQLFTTGLGSGFTQPGFVSSIQFVNGCMTPAAVAALGGASAGKLPPGDAVLQVTNISLSAAQVTLAWGGPGSQFQVQSTSSLAQPAWQALTAYNTNHTLTVPSSNGAAFYRVSALTPDLQVGQLPNDEQSVPTKQILFPAGQRLQFSGRPVDLALSPDRRMLYIKNMNNLLVVDTASWSLLQILDYPASGASMHGIAVSPDGTHVYATGSGNELYDWQVAGNSMVTYFRTISLAANSDPCGLAISADGTTAYVCLSMRNTLAVVDLASGTVRQQIAVGIAPWNVVLSPDGQTAYVSDWGGRFPVGGDLTATSAGTAVVVDARGVAASGTVSLVSLTTASQTIQLPTGLHPSDLALSANGATLYVANANSDTLTVIDTLAKAVRETILVRPAAALPFGSEPNGLALSADGRTLFVACAGNNAIATVELPNAQHPTNSLVLGFFPTDWYPGAIVADTNCVYVVNVKGLGSRNGQPGAGSYSSSAFLGTASRIPVPSPDALSKFTARVTQNGRVPQMEQAQQSALAGQPPVSVPTRVGEPSVFHHVLYILKENKTYDQVFGDLSQGNGNPSLCIYPQNITPNHHALAEQYVLLDNFYCNGVNSADGHSWCTEANNTDHLEKSFGGFARSYTFGDDPLTYSSSGFIWNNVLQHGLSFRNYGEFDYASVPSGASWSQIYTDFTNGTHSITFAQNIGVAALRPYSSTNVPGWNLNIPDVVRAYGFIKELNAAQASGNWAAFHFLYLPNDHTGGTPPAQAQVADNDLALGRVVEAVTKSRFASDTVIFVIEDDPQSGYDHVDGHRSLCLVVSPFTKRGQVVSTFYNQAGVLHTMEQVLGLPPMNQQDAMAPLMFDCFTNVPNFAPYTALPANISLATGGAASLSAKARYYAKKVRKMDFSKPDRINENLFNRYIWHSIKGDARYPAEFVGGHGKGLKQLGLVLAKHAKDDDD